MARIMALTAAPVLALTIAGCQQAEPAPPPEAAATTATTLSELPISTNAVMVGLIDQSADYIFALGNGDMPRTDNDWIRVSGAVDDMILGGAVMRVPGTGEFDHQWAGEENWQDLSLALTQIGQDAKPLVDAKSTDEEAWFAIGSRLIDNCLACHEAFKPEVPSQGILRTTTKRQSLNESIFD